MEKHQGDSFKNSRIKINYKGKKPKVTFSYPNKSKDFIDFYGDNILPAIFLIAVWLIFLVLSQSSLDMVEDIKDFRNKIMEDDIQNRYNECHTFYSENYYDVISKTCDLYALNKTKKYTYNLRVVRNNPNRPTYEFIFDILIIFLPPIIFYLIFRKWIKRGMIKWQTHSNAETWNYVTFKPKDINEKNYVEIPLFSNLRLNYEATEEMSKYLDLVEVKEHPFNEISYKKSGKKKIKKFNEDLWYVRFYFSQKPKSGKLDVEFE